MICNTEGMRVWEFVLSASFIAAGVYFLYGAARGRVIGFAAAIGHDRVVWTRIFATVLVVLGALILISALLKLDC